MKNGILNLIKGLLLCGNCNLWKWLRQVVKKEPPLVRGGGKTKFWRRGSFSLPQFFASQNPAADGGSLPLSLRDISLIKGSQGLNLFPIWHKHKIQAEKRKLLYFREMTYYGKQNLRYNNYRRRSRRAHVGNLFRKSRKDGAFAWKHFIRGADFLFARGRELSRL